MVIQYKLLIVLVVIFAAGHMAYTFIDETLRTAESRIWFFSASLALLFNAVLNMLHLQLRMQQTRQWIICSNVVLLLFTIILGSVVREPQVFTLILIVALVTLTGARLR